LPTKVYERFDLKGFFDCLTGLVLAQIEMKSHTNIKAIFTCCKTATNGSSFCGIVKKLLWSMLVMESWIGSKKKPPK
jgi:hypothetical protein